MSERLPLDQIHRRQDARAIDENIVVALSDSIATLGLISPIRVRKNGVGWEVIAGAHRFAACQRLGLADIECIVVTDDDLHAELAMIDENLCRAELSPSDRARQTARRKALYEELHPETRHGHNTKESGQLVHSFAAETASVTGKDERTVRRDAERGEKVIDEVLDMIRGTSLDTGAYLDRIKKLPPNDQVTAARRDLAAAKARASEARSQTRDVARSKIDADVKARAAKELAEWIVEKATGDEWDFLRSNLYAAGAANIANELTNITGQSIMDRRYG